MIATGTPDQILNQIADDAVFAGINRARAWVPAYRREIYEYQAAALYRLAQTRNRAGAQFLELGTAYGYSAGVMAAAAPLAQIVTLNPHEDEVRAARRNLEGARNVAVVCAYSWDYLARYTGAELDLIFVDGDHKQVKRDLPWWNWLRVGGVMVFHDYSPGQSARPCPPVYRALNEFSAWLRREPDVLIVDDGLAGMAGYTKLEGDPQWQT